MIQLCKKSVILSLKLLFKTIFKEGTFQKDWKKGNVVIGLKNVSKNMIRNYVVINLLPIYPSELLQGSTTVSCS